MVLRPIFFKKNNLLGKALKPFCSPLFQLKTDFFHEKNNNIDYSSTLLYLIDVNWLISFIFRVK